MSETSDKELKDFLEKSTRIDQADIREEYVVLPSQLAFWSARYSEALRQAMLADAALTRTEARRSLEVRGLAEVNGKKITVDEIASRVATDEEVQAAVLVKIETAVEKERLRGVLDALRTKRECLISLGAHVRQEMQGDPAIRRDARITRREQGWWDNGND
jgi:hypothetical protein